MSEPFADLRHEIRNAELDSMSSIGKELDWAGMYAKDTKALLVTNSILRKRVDGLEETKSELEELIAGSRGVDGVHLNGALATWDELINGPYQWLGTLATEKAGCDPDQEEGKEPWEGAEEPTLPNEQELLQVNLKNWGEVWEYDESRTTVWDDDLERAVADNDALETKLSKTMKAAEFRGHKGSVDSPCGGVGKCSICKALYPLRYIEMTVDKPKDG